MLRDSTASDKLNVAIFRMLAGQEDVRTIEVFGASCVYGWVVLERERGWVWFSERPCFQSGRAEQEYDGQTPPLVLSTANGSAMFFGFGETSSSFTKVRLAC